MERLIKEAAAMKDVQEKLGISVDATDMSYANIVKAIHVVQKNMDILGTTQKEAEKTVTGSLNAMKSSWQNLLTAMASGENLDQCMENMVSSVEIFAGNIMPVAERALVGLGTVVEKIAPIIEEKLPDLAEKLLPPLIRATISLVRGLIKALPSIIKTVFETLGDVLGEEFPALGKFFDFFADNSDIIAKFIPVLIGLVAAFKGLSAIKSVTSMFGGGGGGGSAGGKKGGLFGGLFDSLAKLKPTTIIKAMANLALIMAGFAVLTAAFMLVAPALAEMGDTGAVLKMVVIMGAIGILGVALAKFAEIAGKMQIMSVLMGLANMAIVIAGMSVLFLLVGALSLIPFDLGRVMGVVLIIGAIGLVGAALAPLVAILGLAGVYGMAAVALGLVTMAILLTGMSGLVLLLNEVSKIPVDHARLLKFVALIGIVGLVGSSLTMLAGAVGAIPAPLILSGLTNIGLVLGGLTALIIAFGKLTEVEGFTEFLEKGGEVLVKLFNILGKTVGALIGGVGEGISESLPVIGENISAMVTSMQPMFEMMQGVDMGGVGEFFSALGSLLLKLSGSKILDFFTGGTDFSGIAEGLGTLAESDGVKKFFTMVNGIESEAFEKSKQFFEALDGISSLPNAGGWGEFFGGKNDFAGVAKGLGDLAGEGVKNFFNMVAAIDTAAFEKTEQFFEALDSVSLLPNAGGWGEFFAGENDFKGVAEGLTTLSRDGVKNFFNMVQSLDESTFTKAKSLFSSLSSINTVGQTFGGSGQFKTNIIDVADGLSDFGGKTSAFFKQVNSLNLKNLDGLWKSLKNAGNLTVQNLGSVIDESISSLVSKISELPQKMGDALKNNSKNLSNGMVEMWKAAVKASVAPVNKLLDGANHILKEFGSKKKVIEWTPYARGTNGHRGGNALVNDGNGAELVQMPNGNAFIPRGKNVFIPNAPKGMKVLPADKTAQLFGKNSPTFKYAKGIGDIDVWSYYDNAKGLVDKITENISYDGMSGLVYNLGESMVSTFAGEMPAWIDKLFEEGGQSISSYVASKGVTQWLPTVVRALKMEGQYSLANVARTLFQMKTESGGNPKAINLWDSNAKKGIPSKGLMQVIDPTFNAYARDGFDKNIYDPLSNILASIRYAVSRYGSLAKAYRGVGYANGGFANTASIFGEDGLEAAIPLRRDKRKRGLSLWAKTGEMLGVNLPKYTPEASTTSYRTSVVEEHNTYAPQLNFTISGSSNDRAMTRKIKRAVTEAFDEMADGMARSSTKIREV